MIFSREEFIDRLDGDEALMRQMVDLFRESTPRLLEEIHGSIAGRHPNAVARSAHALLGSLGIFGAAGALQLTAELEAQAREENYETMTQTFTALAHEAHEIDSALAAFTGA